jgi:hypothetical protein
MSEQSYTQLDLMFLRQYFTQTAQKIQDDKKIEDVLQTEFLKTLKLMSQIHLQRMLLNVFPCDDQIFAHKDIYEKGSAGHANTLLHFLAKFNTLGFESIDYIAKMTKKESAVVPFLPNTQMITPLDITVKMRDQKQTNSLIKLIQHAPMDNHSRLIGHLFPELIGEMNVPKLRKYFDRRLFQIGVCKSTNVLKIKLPGNDYDMRAISSNIVCETKESIEQSLTERNYPEQSVKLQVFDFPLNENESIFNVCHADMKAKKSGNNNHFEVHLVKSLAMTDNREVFN